MVFGIILAIVGGVLLAWGKTQQGDLDYALSKAFLDSDETALIDLAVYVGIALLIIGVLVFVFTLVKYIVSSKEKDEPGSWTCSCGNVNDENANFCARCGKQRIIPVNKQNNGFWICACGSEQSFENNYCSHCGKKRGD